MNLKFNFLFRNYSFLLMFFCPTVRLLARTFPLSCNRGSCSCNTTNNMSNTSDSNYNNEGRISNANVFVV